MCSGEFKNKILLYSMKFSKKINNFCSKSCACFFLNNKPVKALYNDEDDIAESEGLDPSDSSDRQSCELKCQCKCRDKV